ncbi:MAG: carbamoyltransferase HypF [Nitrospirota bacterium]|nr:carbamoyltransferase HypF [Nitrospirota bacterium]
MTIAVSSTTTPDCTERIRLIIRGVVQGMGFRPFVFRLAHELSLGGWVANTGQGAILEVEGQPTNLQRFQERLHSQLPHPATIQELAATLIPNVGESTFSIRPSQSDGWRQPVISPDLATCRQCVQDINDPQSRRFRYPFTTCTQCGPRYSIVLRLPYDRLSTTMDQFPLCSDCQQEYADLSNRRFHAETMACPTCGPQAALWNYEGAILAQREEALQEASDIIRDGGILAVKGLGGFQLWVDARSSEAVQRLRQRKHRPTKPFAILFPSLEILKRYCLVSSKEIDLLTSQAAPIVLLRRTDPSTLSYEVAPDNPYLGAMLPCTPLHHLMMAHMAIPVVATSGNRAEEPIAIDEQDALERLRGIADAFLVHNRPIARPVDDSVVRVVSGKPMILRRARGFVPTPLALKPLPDRATRLPCILAVGGHLKNTIAVTTQNEVLVSQHIGDLSTAEACTQFERTVSDLLTLLNLTPQAVACDSHPDYHSTRFARRFGQQHHIPVIPVQHHHAHIASCIAEIGLSGPVLGVAWDGAGYGSDETMWGGEFFICDSSGFQRIGHLRPFPLPGGEIGMREPRRVALSLLHEMLGDRLLDLDLPPIQSLGPDRTRSLMALLEREVNCPATSSMGRLFDGVSALLGLVQVSGFEGEAAMALEFLADGEANHIRPERYHIPVESQSEGRWVADWRPMISDIIRDMSERLSPSVIALGFHHALAKLISNIAERMTCTQIILSGGVFQNSVLLRLSENEFIQQGIPVYSPHLFGTNDGGLSLGQCLVAVHTFTKYPTQKKKERLPVHRKQA